MKNIEEQLKDWKDLKGLCVQVRLTQGAERADAVNLLYERIRIYKDKYGVKFDYNNEPR